MLLDYIVFFMFAVLGLDESLLIIEVYLLGVGKLWAERCALHSESTSRIAHISGAIIRFVSLHGFHHIVNMGDDETQMKCKVWSCAYM